MDEEWICDRNLEPIDSKAAITDDLDLVVIILGVKENEGRCLACWLETKVIGG
jgi:hypothetical protein